MKARPTAHSAAPVRHMIVISAAVGAAIMLIGPRAFAQASAPVVSSVLIHPSFDTGNPVVNDNFQYITHPPVRQMAASEPPAAGSPRRGGGGGRRGQAGGSTSSANGSADDTGATPLPPLPPIPADVSSNASPSP